MERLRQHFVASLAALHGPQLVRFFVSRLKTAADAHDLAQEVYLRLLRLERPELIRSPEAYLFTIAANIVRENALRDSSRPLHVALEDLSDSELIEDSDSARAPTPEEATQQAHRVRQLERLLSGLSPKARAALILHRRDGETYKQIAVRLGVSANMVKKYLVHAVAHCRKAMTESETWAE
jgi:RNA polymerase sigma factor (sigma-70 family)